MPGSFPPWHIHVTERVPGPDEACVAESGVEWERLVHNPEVPATTLEGYELRDMNGDTGFSNLVELREQFNLRYGWNPPTTKSGWTSLRPDLTTGMAALVCGDLNGWDTPEFAHWKRWYPDSNVGHAVVIYCWGPNPDDLLICDPGAPLVFTSGVHYRGESITEAALKAFVLASDKPTYWVKHVLEREMVPVPSNAFPSFVDIPIIGTQLYGLDKLPLIVNGKSIKTTGVQQDKLSLPHADPAFRVVALDVGVDQLLLVKTTSCTNIRTVCPPVDCKAAVKAATDPLRAQIASVTAENTTLSNKISAAKSALL